MKNTNQKGFVVPLAVIIVVLLTAGGVYLGMKNRKIIVVVTPDTTRQEQSTIKQEQSTIESEYEKDLVEKKTRAAQIRAALFINQSTSNKKIYTNNSYDFSFGYPEDWVLNEKSSTQNVVVFTTPSDINFSVVAGNITDVKGNIVTLEEYFTQYSYDVNYSRNTKVIGSISWMVFTSNTNPNYGSIRYITVKGDIKYEFIMNINRPVTTADFQLMEEIVGMFTFTK